MMIIKIYVLHNRLVRSIIDMYCNIQIKPQAVQDMQKTIRSSSLIDIWCTQDHFENMALIGSHDQMILEVRNK